jgi:hypothetical protein
MSAPGKVTLSTVVNRLEAIGAEPHRNPSGTYVARCPLHDDDSPSMTVAKGKSAPVVAHCFTCGRSEDWFPRLLVRLADDAPLPPAAPTAKRSGSTGGSGHGTPVAAYDYSTGGKVVARKVRYEDGTRKSFGWSRPYGSSWASGLGSGRRVEHLPLYRADEVAASAASDTSDASTDVPIVYVVEGEKDADSGAAAGLVTTTSAGGAGNPLPDDIEVLRDRHVVVIADNDQAGQRHALAWRTRLTGVAASVRLALPAVDKPKADLTDHLEAGHGVDELRFVADDVSLSAVLDELESWLGTYIATREAYGIYVLALWIAHCHAMEAWYSTPRLLIGSALPGCGKSTTMEHIEHLTPDALMGSNATPALLARITKDGPRPILLDESDNLLDRKREGIGDLIAMLNSGYKKSGTRPVLVPVKGGDYTPAIMPTYAPVAFAGIGDHLPDATLSRTIVVQLDRARPGQVQDSDWQFIEPAAHALRDRLAYAVAGVVDALTIARPDLPVRGRDAEVWRPLVALADAAGGRWPRVARDALAAVMSEAELDREAGITRDRPSLVLLRDLRDVWPAGETFVRTATLVDLLAAHSPETWGLEARFGTIKPKRVGQLLRDYGVRPERNPERTSRGYVLSDLERAWSTYVEGTPDHASNASDESDPSATSVRSVLSEDALTTLDALDASPAPLWEWPSESIGAGQ